MTTIDLRRIAILCAMAAVPAVAVMVVAGALGSGASVAAGAAMIGVMAVIATNDPSDSDASMRLFWLTSAGVALGWSLMPYAAVAAELAPPASATTVSVGSIISVAVEAAVTLFGSLLAAAASLWIKRLADAIGISVDEASRERLEEIIHNGAVATASELGVTLDGRWPVDVRSKMLAGTADYLIAHGRGTLRRLGANPRDREAITQIVVPRLAGIVTSAAGLPLPPAVPSPPAVRG